MLTFTIRRMLTSIPTLLFISIVIFGLLQLAPGDPMAQVPLTVPPEVKQKMREALGLGAPVHIQYLKWLNQFFHRGTAVPHRLDDPRQFLVWLVARHPVQHGL